VPVRGLLHGCGDNFLGRGTLLFHPAAMADDISDNFSMVPLIS